MAKVTEQDVITFLKEKISGLQTELQKAQAALAAFEGSSAPRGAAIKANVQESADQPVKGKRGRKPGKKGAAQPLQAPAEYNATGKLDNKIAWVLANNPPLYNIEIIDRIVEQEPAIDVDKLTKGLMVKLSSLHKKGSIIGNKDGRKFRYQLINS